MAKPLGIIAYGRPEDRLKLAAIAKHQGKTSSRFLIDKIREEYQRLFGNTPPENLVTEGD